MTNQEAIDMMMADYKRADKMIKLRAKQSERELIKLFRQVWLKHYSRQIFYKRIKSIKP